MRLLSGVKGAKAKAENVCKSGLELGLGEPLEFGTGHKQVWEGGLAGCGEVQRRDGGARDLFGSQDRFFLQSAFHLERFDFTTIGLLGPVDEPQVNY